MAQTLPFYPNRIGDQILWLKNFRNKLPNHKTELGLTDDELAAILADCDRLTWLLETLQGAAQTFAQSVTSHLNLIQDGTGNTLVAAPVFNLPSTPAPPANVLPGALKRVMKAIANLKTRPGYEDTTGEDLGVIGPAAPAPDPATTKAQLKPRLGDGGKVQLLWKKQGFPALRIEVDRGAGTWALLDVATKSPYTDPASQPAGTAAIWKYRAIYILDGQPFGQWSDTASVAVQG